MPHARDPAEVRDGDYTAGWIAGTKGVCEEQNCSDGDSVFPGPQMRRSEGTAHIGLGDCGGLAHLPYT